MLKAVKQFIAIVVVTVCGAGIVLLAWPVLFWLGRVNTRTELVVDPLLLEDDPGVDVDGEPS